MDFSEALKALKEGKTISRAIWESFGAELTFINGEFIWKSEHHPQQHWVPTQQEILATDWNIKA